MRNGPECSGEEGYWSARLRTVGFDKLWIRNERGGGIPIARPMPLFAPVTTAILD